MILWWFGFYSVFSMFFSGSLVGLQWRLIVWMKNGRFSMGLNEIVPWNYNWNFDLRIFCQFWSIIEKYSWKFSGIELGIYELQGSFASFDQGVPSGELTPRGETLKIGDMLEKYTLLTGISIYIIYIYMYIYIYILYYI